MNLMDMPLPDLIGVLVGLFFTLFVFSYVFGDNFLFRLAIHIFVGVGAGFAVVIAWTSVILPQLVIPLVSGSQLVRLYLLVPLVLSLLLLAKVSNRLASLGNVVMAILVGIAAATAIGGAVIGTIFPQIDAATSMFALQTVTQPGGNPLFIFLEASLVLVGTIATLVFFHFGVRSASDRSGERAGYIEGIGRIGQGFIAITFGVLFAGVYAATLTAFIERLNFIIGFIRPFLP